MILRAPGLQPGFLITISLILLFQTTVLAVSPTQTAQEKNSAAAEKVLLEAVQLGRQRTQESFSKALIKYEEALRLFRAAGDRAYEGLILNNMAEIFSSLGDRKKALDYFTQALVIFEAAHNPALEAGVLSNIGAIYDDLGEMDKALDYYNKALPLRHTAGDKVGEAITLSNIGYLHHSRGEPQKALHYYNQALVLLRQIGNRSSEAVVLNNISNVYLQLGDIQKALEGLNQALEIKRAEADIDGESSVLNSLGNLYVDQGDLRKALDYYNQSLALTRKVGDRAKEANGIANIALVYDNLGEKQKALETYEQALALVRTVNDPRSEAHALSNIGVVYQSLGNGERALDNFDQAIVLLKKIGDRSGEATALNNVGAVYDALGDPQKAIDYYQQSLTLVQEMGERRTEAILLDNIGASYETLGEHTKALDHHLRAISIAEAVGDKGTLATALRNVGIVYRVRGDIAKAIDYLTKALEQARVVGNPRITGSALNNLAEAYLDSGDKTKARDLYNQSLPLWRGASDDTGAAGALYGIARAERELGNLAQARAQIESALSLIESLRAQIKRRQDLRSSYFASVQKYYEFYIDLLMRLHGKQPSEKNDARALQTAERARARSLLELLKESHADIRQGVDPKLLERERELQQLINARAEQQLKLTSGNRAVSASDQIAKEILSLTAQFEQLEAQIRMSSPRYAALTQPESLTATDIQRRVLDDDTLLLEYSLGDEHSYLWVVGKTALTSYELPKRADVDRAARELYALMIVPNQQAESAEQKRGLRVARAAPDDRRLQDAITKLSKMVLAPAASQLGKKRLLIVADGALQYVPFSALTANANPAGGYAPLIVDHEIISLPSASTLAVLRQELAGREPTSKTIAVLADPVFDAMDERIKKPKARKLETPPSSSTVQRGLTIKIEKAATETGVAREGLVIPRLPGTRQEAEKILALIPAAERKQAIDFAANKATATSEELSRYRFVHFATHGFLDSLNPELSGIVLSLVDEQGSPQNGFLRAHEIYNLKLPAELVVLSACQTGLGKEIRGEGLVGLTRGFMYAGAARVMVSLWSVDDEATSDLMVRLYSRMLVDRLSPASALRSAQLEMLKQRKWQAPYYWAAFVLQGEWK